MKILVLGATGRVGSQVVKLAIQAGHQITALVRTPSKTLKSDQNLTIVQGDALNRKDIQKAMLGTEVVISALSTDGTATLSECIPLLINSMMLHGIKRIVTIGTAGILNSRQEAGLLRYQTKETRHKSTRATEEHHKVYNFLLQSQLDWTIVCPTYLANGEYTGIYRVEADFLPQEGVAISIPDVAEFAYGQLSSPKYLKTRVGIAY